MNQAHWIILFFLCIGLTMQAVKGQSFLSKAEVVRITLENNYDIKVGKNDIEVAKNNTSRELNGYLPTLNGTAGLNSTMGGSTQQFSNGNENKVTNAFNWGANAAVNADYTLLDKTRDANLAQLKSLVGFADLQLRQTIETNLLTAFSSYYEVARLTQNKRVLEQTLEVSKQRFLRAKYQFDYGQGIRLDVLNAEVDIQRDSINLLNMINQLANAKRNLNVAMGRAVNTPLMADTVVIYEEGLSLNELQEESRNKNVAIRLIEQNLVVLDGDLRIIESSRQPTIGANASYNFSFSDNASGSFIDLSTSRGLSLGATLILEYF